MTVVQGGKAEQGKHLPVPSRRALMRIVWALLMPAGVAYVGVTVRLSSVENTTLLTLEITAELAIASLLCLRYGPRPYSRLASSFRLAGFALVIVLAVASLYSIRFSHRLGYSATWEFVIWAAAGILTVACTQTYLVLAAVERAGRVAGIAAAITVAAIATAAILAICLGVPGTTLSETSVYLNVIGVALIPAVAGGVLIPALLG